MYLLAHRKIVAALAAVMLLVAGPFAFAEPEQAGQVSQGEGSADELKTQLDNLEKLDPRKWGIRNGCISLSRIRSINFTDDQTAIVKMTGRKKALLSLRRECRGIRTNGFVHSTRGDTLCARFDVLRVVDSGSICRIESIVPYVELEEDSPQRQESDEQTEKAEDGQQ